MAGLPFTLRQLEIFELLSDLRSFRLASEKLGISPAAVSNQLKTLEDHLGIRLFTRDSGRRPQLTSEGAAFLSDLAPFWGATGKLAGHRRSEGDIEVSAPHRIKLMIGMQLLDKYVRPKLARFLRENPSIHLVFDSAAAFFGPRASILKEQYDIGLFSESTLNPPDERFTALGRMLCGVWGARKLAEGRRLPMTAEELNELPFVMPPAGSYHENEMLVMLAVHGIRPGRIIGRTEYFDVISGMFEAGTCVGVTLEPLLRPEQREQTVLLHRLEDWQLTLYRDPRSRHPQHDLVEQFLISAVMDDPAYPPFVEAG
jgi:DNA-binding transcriptional LysR family regulator